MLDIASAEKEAHYTLAFEPSDLAWADDSNRLFLVGGRGSGRIAVIDHAKREQVTLSAFPFARVPDRVTSAVWSGEKVLLRFGRNAATELDLDTLTFRPADWPEGEEWESFPDHGRWSPQRATTHVGKFRSAGLATSFPEFAFAALDRTNIYTRLFDQIPLSPDESDYLTTDSNATVIAREADGQLDIFYMGLDGGGSTGVRITTTGQPSLDSLQSVQKEACREGRLFAFVASPLVNPLNGKVVGPNRTDIKATVGIKAWEGDNIDAWVVEEYKEIQSGDVVFLLNWTEESSRSDTIQSGPLSTWWGLVSEANPEDAENLVISYNDGINAESSLLAKGAPKEEPSADGSPPQKVRNGDASSMKPSSDDARDFIRRHHELVNEGDLDLLKTHYASRVTYFDNGLLTPDQVIEDQRNYRAKLKRLVETPIEPIYVSEGRGGRFHIHYSLDVEVETNDGEVREVRVVSEITLDIVDGVGRISFQSSKKVE